MRLGWLVLASAVHWAAAMPALCGAAGAPAVVWFSAPVRPGEIVMVHGGGWDADAVVALEAEAAGERGSPAVGAKPTIAATHRLKPLSTRPTCVAFTIPRALALGTYRCRVVRGEAASAAFVLNEPAPWWVQGDGGREASPGGWLRVLGRCLSFDGKARLVLQKGQQRVALPLERQDCWSLAAAVPPKLEAGDYEVHVHNGFGGRAGWRLAGHVGIVPRREVWKTDVFNVVEHGAIPNDGAFDTPAVQAALAAAGKNGGGIVTFPRGRYQITATLDVPRCTLLKGEALELSQLYWPDTEAPPAALIQGSNSFGIEDLFITSGNYLDGIVSDGAGEPQSGNITLRRLRVRLLRDQYVSAAERVRRAALPGYAFRIGGRNVRIEDCDVAVSGHMAFALSLRDSIVARNRFLGGGGYLSACENLIFEHNRIEGGGNSLTPGALYQRNVYWAHNRVERNFQHDREAMTFDGGGHAYQGVLAACEGTRMTLATKRMAWRHGAAHWVNGGMLIMDGRGAGQLRRIRRIENNVAELDRPWTIEPDGASKVMISCFRQRHIFSGNHFEDATVALQLYGSLVEGIVAGNTCARSGGFHNYGMWKGGGPEPSWYVQFLDNAILEGNAYRGSQNEIPALDSHLAIRDRGYPSARYPFTRTCLARRCILHNNARLEVLGGGMVDNALIENCRVANADVGLYVTASASGVILRGNRFENVRQPLTGVIGKALTHPADSALAALSGAATWLGEATPQEWAGLRAQLEKLAATETIAPDAAERVRSVMTQAVRALAGKASKPADAGLMAVLLGLTVRHHTHTLNPVLASGKGGPARMLVSFTLADWSVPLEVDVKPGQFPGWGIRGEKPVRLSPGGSGRQHLHFEVPEGPPWAFRLPVAYQVSGEGWTLRFNGHFDVGSLGVDDWLVVGPFENTSRESIDTTVHPPERKLDVTAEYATREGRRGWRPVQAQKGILDLATHFEQTTGSVAYGLACVRTRRAVPVKVTYSGHGDGVLLYVNGQRVGTRWRFRQWGCVSLREGDNIVQFIATNLDGAWRLRVGLEPLADLEPGDLHVVPAAELKAVPALKAAAKPTPEGRGLPSSLGLDWKLAFEDDFNRDRLGTVLEGRSDAHWRSAEWKIRDGHVLPQSPWTALAYGRPIKPPVRIEYDVYSTSDGVRILGTMLCPRGMSKHRFWGQMQGHGYFLSLGWHNRFSNEVLRNGSEALVDEKGVQLGKDRWYHIIAQFVPPRCHLYLDGKLVLDYKDEAWIAGLNEVVLYSYPVHWFDNLRIYTVSPQAK